MRVVLTFVESAPLKAAASSASLSFILRLTFPPLCLRPRIFSVTVCPVSNPETAMDRWKLTHVSCWELPLTVPWTESFIGSSLSFDENDRMWFHFISFWNRRVLLNWRCHPGAITCDGDGDVIGIVLNLGAPFLVAILLDLKTEGIEKLEGAATVDSAAVAHRVPVKRMTVPPNIMVVL